MKIKKSQQHTQRQHESQQQINIKLHRYEYCNLNGRSNNSIRNNTTAMLPATSVEHITNKNTEEEKKLNIKEFNSRTYASTNKNKLKKQRQYNLTLLHQQHCEILRIPSSRMDRMSKRSVAQNSSARRWWLSMILVIFCLIATCSASSPGSSSDSYSPNSNNSNSKINSRNNRLSLNNDNTTTIHNVMHTQEDTIKEYIKSPSENAAVAAKTNRYSQPLTAIREVVADEDPEDTFRPFIPKDVSREIIARNVFTQGGQFRVFESPESDLRAALAMKHMVQKVNIDGAMQPKNNEQELSNKFTTELPMEFANVETIKLDLENPVKNDTTNNDIKKKLHTSAALEQSNYDYVESPLRRQENLAEDDMEVFENYVVTKENQHEKVHEADAVNDEEIVSDNYTDYAEEETKAENQIFSESQLKHEKQTKFGEKSKFDLETVAVVETLISSANQLDASRFVAGDYDVSKEDDDDAGQEDVGKGEVELMEEKSAPTSAEDLKFEIKSLEDLLLDYVENLFTKGKYEPLPGLVVELQNRHNDTSKTEDKMEVQQPQQQQLQSHSRQRRHLKYTDAKVKMDLPRTLVSSGRLLFLTGLKKVMWPVFMGLQVLKSLLIAMFIPAIIGSFTKLLGKGISSGSAPLFIRPMEPPQELDFRDNSLNFEDEASDVSNNGPYKYNQPDASQMHNQYAYHQPAAGSSAPLGFTRLGMNERQHQQMQDTYMSALQSIGSASFQNSGSLSSGSSGLSAPMMNKPAAPANVQTYQQFQKVPTSSLLLSNYDPFYSPLLSRLDAVFGQLKLTADNEICREKAICLMYANPAKYAPYSNLISAQLSRELNELRKPTSDNPDILRFFKYMRAAKDGQDGVDCDKTFDKCTEFKDFENPAMVSTYNDINKLVQARKIT